MDYAKKSTYTLLLIWLSYAIVLIILQKLGLSFGFRVIPMGEDRNWTSWIINSSGIGVVHQYWQMLDRNPLSPWVWWLATPFIRYSEYSLYFIRKCIDPIFAILTFLLFQRLGRNRYPTFAFISALLVLFWNFSIYYEQFIWCFDIAFLFGLLAIYFYCGFVDSHRNNYSLFAIALVCYLLAIGIYTFQAGVLFAIFMIGFFKTENQSYFERIKLSVKDASFFLILFAIFYCIWLTTSRNFSVAYQFDWSKFTNQFLLSLWRFIYPEYFFTTYLSAKFDFSLLEFSLILMNLFLFWTNVFYLLFRYKIISYYFDFPLAWSFVVLASIAAPIVIVESTSSAWPPGSRSVMVTQIWLPVFYLLCIFIFLKLFAKWKNLQFWVGNAVISLLLAIAIFAGLGYNKRLVHYSRFHQLLVKGIKKINTGSVLLPKFIVIYNGPWDHYYELNPALPNYSQGLFKNPNISVRMPSAYPDPTQTPFWTMKFEKNGVINAGEFFTLKTIPYREIWFVLFDGAHITIPKMVTKKDFARLNIEWHRDTPIDQSKFHNL